MHKFRDIPGHAYAETTGNRIGLQSYPKAYVHKKHSRVHYGISGCLWPQRQHSSTPGLMPAIHLIICSRFSFSFSELSPQLVISGAGAGSGSCNTSYWDVKGKKKKKNLSWFETVSNFYKGHIYDCQNHRLPFQNRKKCTEIKNKNKHCTHIDSGFIVTVWWRTKEPRSPLTARSMLLNQMLLEEHWLFTNLYNHIFKPCLKIHVHVHWHLHYFDLWTLNLSPFELQKWHFVQMTNTGFPLRDAEWLLWCSYLYLFVFVAYCPVFRATFVCPFVRYIDDNYSVITRWHFEASSLSSQSSDITHITHCHQLHLQHHKPWILLD